MKKIKEIFKNKEKFYWFSVVIFLLSIFIIKCIPVNIGNIIIAILFPIYFCILTIGYYKLNKLNFNVPTGLMILYLVIGYFFASNNMNFINVIVSFLFGIVPLSILYYIDKKKGKKIKVEKEEEYSDDKKKTVSILLPFIFVAILEMYYTIATFGRFNFSIKFLSTIVGLILIYSFYYIFLLITRRTSKANKILAIFFLVIFIINEGRIYYTSDTFMITDVLFLQNTGEVAGMAGVAFLNCLLFLFLPTLITILIFLCLFKVTKLADIKITDKKFLLTRGLISLAVLVVLFLPIVPLDKFMTKTVYNIRDDSNYGITASNTNYYYKYGVLSGMYGKFIETRRFEPDGYDEKELKEMLESTEKAEGTWKKPNIIVVFSESFWDPEVIDGITFDKEVTPNFNRLKNEVKTIQMISPAYGGISSNVEFEILTGGSLDFFSKGYTPYMQLFKTGKSENNPNILQELKNNGYKTKILNSSSKGMFNCEKVYKFYALDEVNHLYDEIDLGGDYVTDAYLTDRMIEYFDNKDKDESIFYFIITMGGHMPYFEGRYDNYDVNIVESEFSSDVNGVIHSYAEGIYLADKELGRIYDYINTLDEDTIVIFFGDHLPHLSTPDGKDALFTTGFLSEDYNLESVYKQYNTTALIMSNYELPEDDVKYLSPDLLLTYVINNMDLELSPFYKWLYSTKDVFPSSNFVVAQDKEGKLHYTLNLPKEMQKVYDLRQKVQYMLFK